MRLIDADEFCRKYCDENCGKKKCRDNFDKCVFIESLDEQPIAYDIDKVIDNLHKPAEYINGKYMISIENAIAIVKGGGTE